MAATTMTIGDIQDRIEVLDGERRQLRRELAGGAWDRDATNARIAAIDAEVVELEAAKRRIRAAAAKPVRPPLPTAIPPRAYSAPVAASEIPVGCPDDGDELLVSPPPVPPVVLPDLAVVESTQDERRRTSRAAIRIRAPRRKWLAMLEA